jgi:tRNA nucleotidyltransferase (CCA-adding enzyme)
MASFAGSPAIVLTHKEAELFDLLKSAIEYKQRRTVARVAGGWVRDKLLGRESDDIDIALDDQTGVEFATSLQEYLSSQGHRARRVAVVDANPEQSKHLETAITHVLNLSIDFVNLRAETYTEETRIPEIRFGTPLEDALRRDFTINALFFNINTATIEDLTGRGMDDLRSSVLRTPLDPLVTFKDDPLRVLRAARFAARFNLEVDPALRAAASHADVVRGLQQKISRERVLKELEGMLHGPTCRPIMALELLADWGLFSAVFSPAGVQGLSQGEAETAEAWSLSPIPASVPVFMLHIDALPGGSAAATAAVVQQCHTYSLSVARWFNALVALPSSHRLSAPVPAAGTVLSSLTLLQPLVLIKGRVTMDTSEEGLSPDCLLTPAALRVAFWAVAVSGLESIQGPDKKDKKRGITRLSVQALRDSLKLDGDSLRDVRAIFDASEAWALLAAAPAPAADNSTESAASAVSEAGAWRVRVGLVIRAARSQWPVALWLACARELACLSASAPSSSAFSSSSSSVKVTPHVVLDATTASIIARYRSLLHSVLSAGLTNAWLARPLHDGQSLQQLLGLRPGAKVGAAQQRQVLWQLENPSGSAQDCAAYMLSIVGEL